MKNAEKQPNPYHPVMYVFNSVLFVQFYMAEQMRVSSFNFQLHLHMTSVPMDDFHRNSWNSHKHISIKIIFSANVLSPWIFASSFCVSLGVCVDQSTFIINEENSIDTAENVCVFEQFCVCSPTFESRKNSSCLNLILPFLVLKWLHFTTTFVSTING